MKTKLLFLVDDDEILTDTMGNYLKNNFNNYTIKVFRSGEDCINNLNLNPAIIILDYSLIDDAKANAMNGFDTLKAIKKANKKIEVVMLTKKDNVEIATNCLNFGASDYIIKNEIAHIHILLTLRSIDKKLKSIASAKDSAMGTYLAIGVFTLISLLYFFLNKILGI